MDEHSSPPPLDYFTGQSIADFDAAVKFRLYVTKMKAMADQVDIPSIALDGFKDHYTLVIDLTSMPDAIEVLNHPKLSPGRPELGFTFSLEHVTELTVLGKTKIFGCNWHV